MKVQSIVWIKIVLIIFLSISVKARDKYIKVEKVTKCLNSENLAIQILTSETNPDFKKNSVVLNSTVEMRKKIKGLVQVWIFLCIFLKFL